MIILDDIAVVKSQIDGDYEGNSHVYIYVVHTTQAYVDIADVDTSADIMSYLYYSSC